MYNLADIPMNEVCLLHGKYLAYFENGKWIFIKNEADETTTLGLLAHIIAPDLSKEGFRFFKLSEYLDEESIAQLCKLHTSDMEIIDQSTMDFHKKHYKDNTVYYCVVKDKNSRTLAKNMMQALYLQNLANLREGLIAKTERANDIMSRMDDNDIDHYNKEIYIHFEDARCQQTLDDASQSLF